MSIAAASPSSADLVNLATGLPAATTPPPNAPGASSTPVPAAGADRSQQGVVDSVTLSPAAREAAPAPAPVSPAAAATVPSTAAAATAELAPPRLDTEA